MITEVKLPKFAEILTEQFASNYFSVRFRARKFSSIALRFLKPGSALGVEEEIRGKAEEQ